MELGRYIDGRSVTYDEGVGTFRVGDAPVSAEDIRSYLAAGQIAWASPEIAQWFNTTFPAKKKKNGAIIAIIVVTILFVLLFLCGILVSIAIPVFNAAKTNAQVKSCYANERTIEGAAQVYLAENDALPDSIDALVPTLITTTPTCPSGGTYTWDPTAGTVTCSEHGHF